MHCFMVARRQLARPWNSILSSHRPALRVGMSSAEGGSGGQQKTGKRRKQAGRRMCGSPSRIVGAIVTRPGAGKSGAGALPKFVNDARHLAAVSLRPRVKRRRILKPTVLKAAAAVNRKDDGRERNHRDERARRAGGGAGRFLRARRLRPHCARHPAAGRAVPRPLRRGHPQAHVSDHRAGRRRILPAPRPHHSGVARLSRLAASRQAGGLLLSRAGVPSPQRRAGRIPASRHRILRAARQGGGRRRDARRSGWKRPRITGWPRPTSRSATSRCLPA